MKQHPSPILAALLLISATATARADGSLPPETAQRLKEATVYVKVAIGPLTISGSGFVIQSSGDSALIVTNQHVVAKPKVLAPSGFIPGLRGRDRLALMRIQQTLAANEPAVSVVFNSGEPNEQAVKAEVLCQVEDPDLAVLKVSGLKGAPRAIEFGQAAQPARDDAGLHPRLPLRRLARGEQGQPQHHDRQGVGLQHPQGPIGQGGEGPDRRRPQPRQQRRPGGRRPRGTSSGSRCRRSRAATSA